MIDSPYAKRAVAAGMPGVEYWQNARPITRESFLAAYVDANPYRECRYGAGMWSMLHCRELVEDEIDEDPGHGSRGPACEA